MTEGFQAGSVRHCGSNGANFQVGIRHLGKMLPHCFGKGDSLFSFRNGRRHSMEAFRRFFGGRIALSLLRFEMDDAACLTILCLAEQFFHHILAVSVGRAHIGQSEVLKNIAPVNGTLNALLQMQKPLENPFADERNEPEKPGNEVFGFDVSVAGAQFGKTFCKPAGVFGNGHFVFIQNNDQTKSLFAVVECLMDHTTGISTVTEDTNGISVRMVQFIRLGKSQRGGKRCGTVPRSERVVLALGPFWEPGNAAALANGGESVAPPG